MKRRRKLMQAIGKRARFIGNPRGLGPGLRQARLSCGALLAALVVPALAAGDAERGAQAFRACAACHSLAPGEHLTGPSLANIFGRRAGTVEGFSRYSKALREADIVWDEKTLDAWLTDPQKLVPGNLMFFRGIRERGQREDLIALLKSVEAAPQARKPAQPRLESLRDVEPQAQVTAIRYCKGTYFVTLATGDTFPFWEFNLRFKTNVPPDGPPPGKPVILRAGMMGDRAFIIFSTPDEISRFIQARCE